ncbi:MAG TPA: DUF3142 domain-containing protein [Pyrinomonadaceae bacterium]|nr:DUF3142 domain-containing protein [Pyrinomonadaceae bacterium]
MRNPLKQILGRHARRLAALACLFALVSASLAWRFHVETPRAWAAAEVPVAFWSWRDASPLEDEVESAARVARTLFLRAGQFDLDNGKLERIRAADGQFPRALPLHLVYNGTRTLLNAFERVDETALADAIAATFKLDSERAAREGARVDGIQLDFDVPTRLLPRYERVLRALCVQLPPDTQLSITGLPAWMQSASLARTLDAVAFWIPQCYGASIPQRLEDVVSISSPELVAACVAGARRLGRPFYAGLAAYGYAILYSERGALVELRGDLDPAAVARDPNFELIERRPFASNDASSDDAHAATAREWRYVYRALGDGLFDNLKIRAGDRLLLDVPAAETLRAYARAAREQGGRNLLGLCIFRLPAKDDPTNLTLPQIAAALADRPTVINTNIKLETVDAQANRLRINATNDGEACALNGDDALALVLRVPAGSVRGVVSLENVAAVEPLCSVGATANDVRESRPCGLRRADTLRLRLRSWRAGETAQAVVGFDGDSPRQLPVRIRLRADDGRTWQNEQLAITRKGDTQ